jgi:hypothetical protein
MAQNYCEQGGGRTSRETVDRRSAAKIAARKGAAMIAALSVAPPVRVMQKRWKRGGVGRGQSRVGKAVALRSEIRRRVVPPIPSGSIVRTCHAAALSDATLTAGVGLRRTYRPRRPSNIPNRRRTRAASLSRSPRTLRWTSGRERATTGWTSVAGAGPAFAGPIVGPAGATPDDTSMMARITATPRNLIC